MIVTATATVTVIVIVTGIAIAIAIVMVTTPDESETSEGRENERGTIDSVGAMVTTSDARPVVSATATATETVIEIVCAKETTPEIAMVARKGESL